MAIEIRQPADEGELKAAMRIAFTEGITEEDWERERITLPLQRAVAAFDDGRAVALAGAYEFDLTIPGGQLPCAGVTWVGVQPTHRRQGILRRFMTKQLADAREWGEPIAALWASEASIYGRFGYGLAAPSARLEAESGRFELRDDPGRQGSWRLVDAATAFDLVRPVYEHVRQERPGMRTRDEHWWRKHRLADPEAWRRGASEKFYAVLELDGAVAGYAIYRVKDEWEGGFARGVVRVLEAFGTSPAAEREVWRYLVGIDLTTTVDAYPFDPASPLFLMVRDARALHLRLHDGLWLRLVDVDAALRARSYRSADAVVVGVRDELCPWNEGAYRLGPDPGRADATPELELDVADLAAVYLGAFDFAHLARADRVRELTPGAVERASDLVRTPLPPFCPEVF
jgi:predicted acetyltransferase